MPNNGFAELQRHLESITSGLNNATDPDRRKVLLREMSQLLAESERISSQPPKNEAQEALTSLQKNSPAVTFPSNSERTVNFLPSCNVKTNF